MQRRRECNSEGVRCRQGSDARTLWKAELLSDVRLSFVSLRDGGKERAIYGEENGPVLRSIEGWEEGFVVSISTPGFTIS